MKLIGILLTDTPLIENKSIHDAVSSASVVSSLNDKDN